MIELEESDVIVANKSVERVGEVSGDFGKRKIKEILWGQGVNKRIGGKGINWLTLRSPKQILGVLTGECGRGGDEKGGEPETSLISEMKKVRSERVETVGEASGVRTKPIAPRTPAIVEEEVSGAVAVTGKACRLRKDEGLGDVRAILVPGAPEGDPGLGKGSGS